MTCLFDTPIYVCGGLHPRRAVHGIEDAIAVLGNWPDDDRGLVHETVLAACRDVVDGRRTIDVAQRAFLKWAERRGILLRRP